MPELSGSSEQTRLPEAFISGINECAQNYSSIGLGRAITTLRDTFPKLSLWERIKDFFGMSDTADNRRDAAVLYAASALAEYTHLDADYPRVSEALAGQLQEAGLAPVQENALTETLVAGALARLLDRNPDLADRMTLQEVRTEVTDTGSVCLHGRVSFGNAETGAPEFLRDVSLPFLARAASPLLSGNIVQDMLEEGCALSTLFRCLMPEEQMSLQLLSCLQGRAGEQLFSAEGLLGWASQLDVLEPVTDRMTPPPALFGDCVRRAGPYFVRQGQNMVRNMAPEETTVRSIRAWSKLAEAQMNSWYDTETSAVMLQFPFTHKVPLETAESQLQKDLHRSGLNTTVVVIDGEVLSPEITRHLQATACTAMLRGNNTDEALLARGTGEAWTRLIQDELTIEEATARQAAAAVMYAGFQGGAGRGNTGMLMKFGPPESGMNNSQSVLYINTAQNGGSTVMQAEFMDASWRSIDGRRVGTDFRMCGVAFSLPASGAKTASEMAVAFTQNHIDVEGFCVRYPEVEGVSDRLDRAGMVNPPYPDNWRPV